MTHNITVEGGTSARLPTAGKYCDRDIVVTATGGGSVSEPATISGTNLHNKKTDIPNTYLGGAAVIAYNGWKTTERNGKAAVCHLFHQPVFKSGHGEVY